MFTGIIEEVGEITGIEDADDFVRVRISAPRTAASIQPGDSIAASGVCITAREVSDDGFTADLSRETLERTTFGAARPGEQVNIERALRAGQPLGGHIVQGHVDGVGRMVSFDRSAGDWMLEVGYDPTFAPRLVWKGSVAVDGVSLTVAELSADAFRIAIIPFTWAHTNLRFKEPGDPLNLEFDVLAKYVERMLEPYIRELDVRLESKASK